MQLREARLGEGLDHRLGLRHRILGREMLPRVGPQMISTEDQPVEIETDGPRDALDEVAEVLRRHSGVAAVLVDLVAGRLHEHVAAASEAMAKSRLDHPRMGGADRRDADALAFREALRNPAEPSGGGVRHRSSFPAFLRRRVGRHRSRRRRRGSRRDRQDDARTGRVGATATSIDQSRRPQSRPGSGERVASTTSR